VRSGRREQATPAIPRDEAFDSTYALLSTEGYEFITNRCRRYGTDVFATRIMLRRAFCMQGAEAAEVFYHPGRFTRRHALPLFALTLIQDLGSVMLMDGEEHRRRKAMFLSLMSPEALSRLTELTMRHWRLEAERWQRRRQVVLFHAAHVPICAAICEWAGLKLSRREVRVRAREFEAMVEGAGAVGPRNWHGHIMRSRTERWARKIVRDIRSGAIPVEQGTAAHIISTYRDQNGRLLDVKSAGVELINLLRPTVANARFIVFAAVALHSHPEWKDRLAQDDTFLAAFVDEVRRYYPFIPLIGGRVLVPFEWRGHQFRKHDWLLFDLYGSNHDARTWGDPDVLRPERFLEQTFGPYDLVSHGGGDRRVTHRCPGEWITVEQMKAIARFMVREMSYEVPIQDLRIDLARIPALPASGFVIGNVALRDAGGHV
jgi:fatty-acid peroxygenase